MTVGRILTWAVALALLGASGAQAAGEPRASLPDIEDEVMCLICGTTLELSEAPQAERQRALIRRLIDRGNTKAEVKDALVAEYGPDVLAVPDDEGFELSAWIVPPALLALAAGFVAARLWRGRSSSADEQGDPEVLAPSDARRLERELSAHDL